jgi:hypothetical protein
MNRRGCGCGCLSEAVGAAVTGLMLYYLVTGMYQAVVAAIHRRVEETVGELRSALDSLSSLATWLGRAGIRIAIPVISASMVLDAIDAILRGAQGYRDGSREGLALVFADTMNLFGKYLILVGFKHASLTTAILGIGTVLFAEALKLALTGRHSLAQYRDLITDIADFIKSLTERR